jgi:hypothetical protein
MKLDVVERSEYWATVQCFLVLILLILSYISLQVLYHLIAFDCVFV